VEPRAVVTELWRRIQARDWDGVGELLAEDFVLDFPDTQQRICGRTNYVEFNRNYPEGWSIELLSVLADRDRVVSEVRVPHAELGEFFAISLFEIQNGRIAGGREYWLQESPEEPTGWRAQWVEQM
jgi:ketosteroid isomerase-like protein